MQESWQEEIRQELESKRAELSARLERITANVRRSLDSDSEERAKQLEDSEVVDALGNEARDELNKISVALARIAAGEYGLCIECGETIASERMRAYPYAGKCIDCAELDEAFGGRK
jgi:RNA polymerase-binding protein DksA